MKSTVLLICLAAAVGLHAALESKPAEPARSATPSKPDATDEFIGRELGQRRTDNGLKMIFLWCPPGKFTMGSPPSEPGRAIDENQVSVELTNGFWLGKYEVSQTEWKQVMATEPWKDQPLIKEGNGFPATSINWHDAAEFCRKLTEQERKAERLSARYEFTLPTEAQWEYACRARTETSFSFGADESKLGEYAWYFENARNVGEDFIHQVGQKQSNPWGFHDLHGNVWEWCRDVYTENPPGGRDPEVAGEGALRSVRGGGFNSAASTNRSAFRGKQTPDNQYSTRGFRVALNIARETKP